MTPSEEDASPRRSRRCLVATVFATVGIVAIVGLSAVAGVLEREQGCPPADDFCYGPEGRYLTVFDAPLTAQTTQAGLALAVSLAVFAGSVYAVRQGALEVPIAYLASGCVLLFLLSFLAIVAVSPTVYVYG